MGIEISDAEVGDLRKLEARDSDLSVIINGLILQTHLQVDRAITIEHIKAILLDVEGQIKEAIMASEGLVEAEGLARKERFTEMFLSHLYDICLKGLQQKGLRVVPRQGDPVFADRYLDAALRRTTFESEVSAHATS
jgi:hypothetical protein